MNFAEERGFNIKKAGGFGFTVLMHVLIACAVIFGLRTTFVSKPKMEEIQITLPTVAPPIANPTPPPPSKPQQKTVTTVETPPVKSEEPAPTPAPPDPAPATQANDNAPSAPNSNPDSTNTAGTPGVTSPAFTDLNSCKPEYPQAALLAEQTGTVRVKFIIGTDGNLVSASVLKSSGHKLLDKAAIDGLSRCKFKAAMQDGNPVQSWFVSDYVWSLNE
jgi:protein TonB